MFKGHQPTLQRAGTSPTRSDYSEPNTARNVLRNGASTISLSYLFQSFTTPTAQNFFFLSHLNLTSLSLKPLPVLWSKIGFVYIDSQYKKKLNEKVGGGRQRKKTYLWKAICNNSYLETWSVLKTVSYRGGM